jgi:large subunit ribosomal protein L35
MPKMKTHSGAAKRFKKTGGGKIVRNKANKQHILTKTSTKRKRHLRGSEDVAQADVARIKRLIPGF